MTAIYDPATDSSAGTSDFRVGADTDNPDVGFEGLILDLEPHDGNTTTKRPVCNCGCGERTSAPKSIFRQGHDQRLKGKLIRAGRAGAEVTILRGGVANTGDAASAAGNLLNSAGVAQVLAGIANAPAVKAEPVEVPWTETAPVKIGRWTYPARVRTVGQSYQKQRNTKRDGSGEWVAA